jgi:general secretion pathway protein M
VKLSRAARRAAALAALAAALAGGYAVLVWPLVLAHRALDERIAAHEHRLAQYRRAALEREHDTRLLEDARRRDAAAPYYLAEQGAALARAELQGLLKRAVEEAGGELLSTQGLPAQKDEREIAVRVRARGDARALQGMLYALEGTLPVLFVRTLSVDAAGEAGASKLLIALDVSAFTPQAPRRQAAPRAPAPVPAFASREHFRPIVERVLFDPARRPSAALAAPAAAAARAPGHAAGAQLTLTGVLIRRGRAMALLRLGDSPELIRLERGASFEQWQLVDVREDRITLRRGARTYELGLAAPGALPLH